MGMVVIEFMCNPGSSHGQGWQSTLILVVGKQNTTPKMANFRQDIFLLGEIFKVIFPPSNAKHG